MQALSDHRYRARGRSVTDQGPAPRAARKLIAEHTDWRFLNELKRELKA